MKGSIIRKELNQRPLSEMVGIEPFSNDISPPETLDSRYS